MKEILTAHNLNSSPQWSPVDKKFYNVIELYSGGFELMGFYRIKENAEHRLSELNKEFPESTFEIQETQFDD